VEVIKKKEKKEEDLDFDGTLSTLVSYECGPYVSVQLQAGLV
jgi:hypothetical protein